VVDKRAAAAVDKRAAAAVDKGAAAAVEKAMRAEQGRADHVDVAVKKEGQTTSFLSPWTLR
jgi:hypothetical protein